MSHKSDYDAWMDFFLFVGIGSAILLGLLFAGLLIYYWIEG